MVLASSLPLTSYDCVIIGGGPAGTTVAALVAEAGFSTLLLEREKMPRFHVGESLMPETYWPLKRLGVLEKMKSSIFVQKTGVQFVSPSGKDSQPFYFQKHDPRECAQTWHVERSDFDHLLFQNASEKGAVCQDEMRVLDVSIDNQASPVVTFRNSSGTAERVATKVLVDATGQNAFLANRLGLQVYSETLRKASIWGYFRGAQRNHENAQEFTTILHTKAKESWFWYIPLSNDVVSVGLVGDTRFLFKDRQAPQEIFDAQSDNCPGLQQRLESAKQLDTLHVAKEFSYTTTQKSGDGWVLVGDAYGFIDPIYSTGVYLALKSGELAADSIIEGLQTENYSASQLGKWTDDFDTNVLSFRKLVDAFYTSEFSFAHFLKDFPEHQGNLTDLLIGRAFYEGADRIFEDLDPALAMARSDQTNSNEQLSST